MRLHAVTLVKTPIVPGCCGSPPDTRIVSQLHAKGGGGEGGGLAVAGSLPPLLPPLLEAAQLIVTPYEPSHVAEPGKVQRWRARGGGGDASTGVHAEALSVRFGDGRS